MDENFNQYVESAMVEEINVDDNVPKTVQEELSPIADEDNDMNNHIKSFLARLVQGNFKHDLQWVIKLYVLFFRRLLNYLRIIIILFLINRKAQLIYFIN